MSTKTEFNHNTAAADDIDEALPQQSPWDDGSFISRIDVIGENDDPVPVADWSIRYDDDDVSSDELIETYLDFQIASIEPEELPDVVCDEIDFNGVNTWDTIRHVLKYQILHLDDQHFWMRSKADTSTCDSCIVVFRR